MTESEQPIIESDEPEENESRIHYHRATIYATLRATEGPSCDSLPVTVPFLVATKDGEDPLAGCRKALNYFFPIIKPDSVNPDRFKSSSPQEDD